MSTHLELILEDLKEGLRRRAQRRRRARTTAASVATSVAIAVGVVSAGGLLPRTAPTAAASDGSVAVRMIADGCVRGDAGLACWSPDRN